MPKKSTFPRAGLMGAFILCLPVGCGVGGGSGGGDTLLTQTPVEQVGKMLQTYRRGAVKPPVRGDKSLPVYKPGPVPPPRGLADLYPVSRGYPRAFEAIRNRDVLLYWKTDLSEAPEASSVVLAYARTVPESGGQVLMQDGTTRSMTSSQFQAAQKPAGASIDEPTARTKTK